MKNTTAQEPLKGVPLLLVTLSLSMATFMQMLDSTISNVAIPTISGFLGASTDEGTWVITSFGVANAISIPVTGRLAQRFGERRLFLFSVALFALSSLCCGLSVNLEMLICFRVMQGLVAGPLIPLSQSLLLRNYPPEKRNLALAMWSMTVIIAPIFGPIIGGYICENYDWGWIFLINVPLGGIVLSLTAYLLKDRETPTTTVKINLVALSLLTLGVGSLQIMLDKGKDLDWFNSNIIIILTIMAVFGIGLLIIWEATNDNPIIDLSLFRSRNFSIGMICIASAYLIYAGAIVLMPQLLQIVFNYTSIYAGLAYAPIGIMPLIIAPLIGRYGANIDMRVLVTCSFMIYALCYYWRAITFNPELDFFWVVIPQFIQGIAVACFFLPLTTISLSGLSPEKFASATSLSNFFRTLSGSIGTSITMTLWSRRESFHHAHLTESINAYNPSSITLFERLHSLGLDQRQAEVYINDITTSQSLLMSANDIFHLSAIVFLGLTLLVWLAKPPFNTARPHDS
ncbi:DHA2 family efflux MFS transporter permease subunit [Enterobacter sp. HG048]|uniref:DHA2 family efflux MFS transporter permease subunit n=1 Tax=Enterobacter sp. HG048 TaxID=2969756 RepID=UPI002151F8F1|nr:DHA2 family efflux MFS transporter permease subunit [Enterobacter sp. HG048]MCR6469474.1 DHA2 family efflux MFS transporter permease subunit [Enterobacter sp. HG048]